MDPRVERHADIVVDTVAQVEQGDMVGLMIGPSAEPLEMALYERIGEIGATPYSIGGSSRASRAFIRAIDNEEMQLPEHVLGFVEACDVLIQVRGGANISELSDVDPQDMQAYSQLQGPLIEAMRSDDLSVALTQYPTTGYAQKAEMSTSGYEDFVWNAINKDWDAQYEFQQQLVDILDPADEVRIVAGEETDISMSIAGNPAINGVPVEDVPSENLPGGEVFTAPIPDSVEGTVRFDMPVVRMGREVHDAYLEFEDGEVVEFDAERNVEVLEGILGTDDGARRLGELGIGMNRDIDRFTYNMLFDEKMGDTVHMAVGRSIEESVGEGNPENESNTHVDMIVDMSEDSRIEVDGEAVQRDGTFVFEERET